jgi:RNA polymerase sigma-70 factor (ECF subfamily)
MTPPTETSTRATLLLRLRDAEDRQAWEAFVDRYAPMIFHWCRRYGLQDSDAADVTQDVLIKLVRVMREFEYDPARGTFRGWLKTVTSNTLRDVLQGWKHMERGSGDTRQLRQLAGIQQPQALDALSKEIESQHERELLAAAEQRVRARVKPNTWKAYRLTAVDGQRAADVAGQVDMTVAEVYVAKSRVVKMLRAEIQKLDSGDQVGRPQSPTK